MTEKKVCAALESVEEEANDIGNEATTLEETHEDRGLQPKLGDG